MTTNQSISYTFDGLQFVETCFACPEQYDVFDENHKLVGYVRLRYGNLTCEYPDCGGELIYEHTFPTDDLKGSFEENERYNYLGLIAKLINEKRSKENV